MIGGCKLLLTVRMVDRISELTEDRLVILLWGKTKFGPTQVFDTLYVLLENKNKVSRQNTIDFRSKNQ